MNSPLQSLFLHPRCFCPREIVVMQDHVELHFEGINTHFSAVLHEHMYFADFVTKAEALYGSYMKKILFTYLLLLHDRTNQLYIMIGELKNHNGYISKEGWRKQKNETSIEHLIRLLNLLHEPPQQ